MQTKNPKHWLRVHKEVLVSRIKIYYAFVGNSRKAAALLRFPASAQKKFYRYETATHLKMIYF